jgi:hypothetical protein
MQNSVVSARMEIFPCETEVTKALSILLDEITGLAVLQTHTIEVACHALYVQCGTLGLAVVHQHHRQRKE